MRTATLVRNVVDDDSQGTFGTMTLDDGNNWHSLELPWRDNQHDISCIPTGVYICTWITSPSKGPVYTVTNVPNRSNVLIHAGNWGGSVSEGFFSNFLGCIGLGKSLGQAETPSGNMQAAILSSKQAIAEFEANLGQEDFTLTISNQE